MINLNRDHLRQSFLDAWRKHQAGDPLTALEAQIVAALTAHPEYHVVMEDPAALARDFPPEGGQTNPFLHLSLHLAVHDQLATNRPPGVRAIFDGLRRALGDEHAAQHQLLERLGQALWQAQRDGAAPDEQAYLQALRADLRRLDPHWREPPAGL